MNVCIRVCVHMYVCARARVYMCVYVYVCTCVCTYVRAYICVHERMYACMHARTYARMYVCKYACVCVVDQSEILDYDLNDRGWVPGEAEFFSLSQNSDWPWCPPSFLSSGYRCKVAGA
jgi:hypothetical protein